jgi:RNA polymerase sigma-70 factor, ECF subfamily
VNLAFSQALAHGRDSYAELYRTHYAEVESLCRSMLGSPEQAEDASSEIFARLPRAMETYNPSLPFSNWLARVARNQRLDALRRRCSKRRVLEPVGARVPELAAPGESPLDQALSSELQRAVREALASLPARYFVPSVLRYFSDLSHEEIARTLGIRRAHVALLIYRAKARLRKELTPRFHVLPEWARETSNGGRDSGAQASRDFGAGADGR